jgi:hypothetical protein
VGAGTSASGRRAGDLVGAGAGRPTSGAHGDFESATWRFPKSPHRFFWGGRGAAQFLGFINTLMKTQKRKREGKMRRPSWIVKLNPGRFF